MADDHAAAADLVNGGRPETDYQNQEIKIEKEKKTRTGNATGTVTEIEEETEIGTRTRKKTETKKGTGIGTGTRIGIATIGITVKEENTEIALMIMIATEAVILKGEETMNGMGVAGIGLAHALVLGAGIADLGLALVQKASELVDLIWRLQLKLWFHNFLLFQPQFPGTAIPGMFPNMLPMGVGQFNPLVIQPQAMTQQATRHARRVYVGGLPPTANEQSVAIYFNQVMAAIGGNTAGPGDAVLNVYINHDKKFAFVEMRSVEEASNAMALDGILFEGAPVKVRRPTDYNPSLAAALGPSQPSPNLNLAAVGLTPGSAGGLEGPDRIFVGGLPYYFTEAQVRELLESFGPLRGFDLVKDRETGNSKGYAFCVYQDLNVTDIACAALNGIKMGDKTLTVRRANQGAAQPRPEQESILLQAQQQVQLQKLVYQVGALPTKVVCLTQVVSADELKDDEEYEDIMEDMRLEAGKYGNLIKVVIPRPDPSGLPVAGVGKVFLEYADVDGATKAKTAMHGRKFGGNPVVAVFYPENKFASAEYDA
uniref:Splicing factor U2af large subunit n=1 Tax=Oryza glumipatula TaxID=40148 RepID=A0A0E0BM77_9ORYZ